MANKKITKSAQKKPAYKIHYPEQFQVFYSNHAGLSMSSYDLAIDFGLQHQNAVQMNSRVILSPQHAKMLSAKLSEILGKYEKDFGEIAVAPKSK